MLLGSKMLPVLGDEVLAPVWQLPLSGGERIEVRGFGVGRFFVTIEPPHPALSPPGRG
jgi:hypothetical protein